MKSLSCLKTSSYIQNQIQTPYHSSQCPPYLVLVYLFNIIVHTFPSSCHLPATLLSFCSMNMLSLFLSQYLCNYCSFHLEFSYLDFSTFNLQCSFSAPGRLCLTYLCSHSLGLHPPMSEGTLPVQLIAQDGVWHLVSTQ